VLHQYPEGIGVPLTRLRQDGRSLERVHLNH
jgi:hypothetical protein